MSDKVCPDAGHQGGGEKQEVGVRWCVTAVQPPTPFPDHARQQEVATVAANSIHRVVGGSRSCMSHIASNGGSSSSTTHARGSNEDPPLTCMMGKYPALQIVPALSH